MSRLFHTLVIMATVSASGEGTCYIPTVDIISMIAFVCNERRGIVRMRLNFSAPLTGPSVLPTPHSILHISFFWRQL